MNYHEIKLIETPKNLTAEQKELISRVNNYLVKQKGLIGDFKNIQTIIDRQANQTEQTIKHLLPLPFYIGIIVMVLVVALGLFWFPTSAGLRSTQLFSLMKIALVAPLVGLLLTFINWSFSYRRAILKTNGKKNRFYDFINEELEQHLSHNITSSIYALQGSMASFNKQFNHHIGGFNSVMQEIHACFKEQTGMMREMRDLDMSELSEYNIRVMREIRESTKEFENFNAYLKQTNALLENMTAMNDRLKQNMDQNAVLQTVADSIKDNMQLNKQLIEVLHADLREIDTRKKFMADAVINVDHALQKSLEELKVHTQHKLNAIRDIVIKEELLMEKRPESAYGKNEPKMEELIATLQQLVAEMRAR